MDTQLVTRPLIRYRGTFPDHARLEAFAVDLDGAGIATQCWHFLDGGEVVVSLAAPDDEGDRRSFTRLAAAAGISPA